MQGTGTSAGVDRAVRKWIAKNVIAVFVLAAILFVCSGDVRWPGAWAFLALVGASQATVGLVLGVKDRELLAERAGLQPGTKGWDKVIAPVVGPLASVAGLVVAGLDHRLGWSLGFGFRAAAAAFAVAALGSALFTWAITTNRFFSATVRIQRERGHRVITAGPYGFVRHPGYTGMIAMYLSFPFVLGSVWCGVAFWAAAGLLIVRTVLEDRTLRRELEGYEEYAGRVRWKLAPGVW